MTHTTSSGGLSSLGFGAPVEGTHASSRVGALGASLLLLVVGTVTATLAKGVGFGVTLTGRSSTFGLFRDKKTRRQEDKKTRRQEDKKTRRQGDGKCKKHELNTFNESYTHKY